MRKTFQLYRRLAVFFLLLVCSADASVICLHFPLKDLEINATANTSVGIYQGLSRNCGMLVVTSPESSKLFNACTDSEEFTDYVVKSLKDQGLQVTFQKNSEKPYKKLEKSLEKALRDLQRRELERARPLVIFD